MRRCSLILLLGLSLPFIATSLLLPALGKASAIEDNDPAPLATTQVSSDPVGLTIVPLSTIELAGADSSAVDVASPNDPETPTQQQPQPQTPSSAEEKNQEYERQTGTSKDRLGFILPNFLTIDAVGKVPPLTWQQKFKIQARSSFDWTKIPWYTLLAGISQASNSHAALGQGGAGYGKRVALTAADNTIENFFGSAVLPSLLHQDPRFYILDHGSILRRALNPIEHIVVTRGDSGNRQFNFSEILGSGIAAAISTYAYHPRSERTLGEVGQTWYTEIIYDTVSLEAKEFWPLLRRKIRKDKNQNQVLQGLQRLEP